MQRAQRQRKAIGQRIPVDIFAVVFIQPVKQPQQPRLLRVALLFATALAQQHQQLHKGQLLPHALFSGVAAVGLLQLRHQRLRLRHHPIADAPVRRVAAIVLLRQQIL